jgi:hypothetical protein
MSRDVVVQIRSYLETIEASAPPITLDELEQVSSQEEPASTFHEYADLTTLDLRQAEELPLSGGGPAPTRRKQWTVVVAAVTAAAIVLVVGVVVADRDSFNVVTEPAVSPTVTEPTALPTVTEPAPSLTLTDSVGNEWSQVPQDEEVFTAHMQSVTVGGPGLVAVGGNEEDESSAAVWTSVDGITWSRVSHDEEVFGGAVMVSVTVGGPGLVAVGWDEYEDESSAAVWTSVDGITWSRVSHDDEVFGGAVMDSVTVGGPGLVAVGQSLFERVNGGDGTAAAVWTSVDGITWTHVPDNEEVFSGSRNLGMRSVAAGGPGLVAVGSADPHNGEDAAVWTSVDGITWSRVSHDEEVFGGTGPALRGGEQNMTDVTAGGPGLVAVGWEFLGVSANAVVWTSVDGMTWTRVPNDDDIFGGVSHQAIWGVTTDGPTVVAVGEDRSRNRDEGEVAVWTSDDGINWARGLPDEDGIGSGYPLSVTVGGPGLVAVGNEMAWVATPVN